MTRNDSFTYFSNGLLRFSVLLTLVWIYLLSEAKAPLPRYDTRPPDYYQVIITNNLFRPLGWTKPKPLPRFELIATVMKSDGRHKALILDTRNRKVYYVAAGDELESGVTVEKIKSRRVTVNENGKLTVYRLKF